MIPSAEEGAEDEIITATAEKISKDSLTYTTFGEGWVFTFCDKNGKEIEWVLEGGSLSTVTMKLVLKGMEEDAQSLLQLQIIGK